ncbi:MAG: SurA N-terminal domain-containing protein [Candidatus Nanopelagicales bacterium]
MSRTDSVMSSRRIRFVTGLAGLAVLGTAIAGCGPNLAGAAAVVGSTRITDQALTQQSDLVTSTLGIEPSAQVNVVLLQRLITQELVAQLAAREGVTVSQGEVESFLQKQYQQAGGQAALEQALLQSGIPSDQIQEAARTTLLVQKLGEKLAPGQDSQAQQGAVGIAIIALSKQEGTQVSPRFGSWDGKTLEVTAPPNDLSKPVLNDPAIAPLPEQQAPQQQAPQQQAPQQ